MAKIPAPKPVVKEEKKERTGFAAQKLDPTKSFPGAGRQITGKVISEEETKAAVVKTFI